MVTLEYYGKNWVKSVKKEKYSEEQTPWNKWVETNTWIYWDLEKSQSKYAIFFGCPSLCI